jgi:hypothetical protein
MNMQKKLKTIMVLVVVTAMALGASLNAGDTQGNPFKKPKKHPPKQNKPVGKPAPPARPTTFSGQAIAVDLTNSVTGVHLTVGDTGALIATGGTLDLMVGATNLGGIVNIGMAHVSVTGGGAETSSQAQVQNFSAVFISGGVTNSISFTLAEALATAQCASNGAVLSGSTQIQGLLINGTSITVTGVNQIITIPGGTIVLNAQLTGTSKAGAKGKIEVAAIFLMLEGGFSGAIAFAKADISCGSTPPPGGGGGACGKLTGGGFIVGTPSGANGSFGVSGGIRRGAFWGHLNYIDHDTGMHVTSTSVTGFAVVDPNTRQIDYNVDIDGVAGTARVICSDQGEPGRNDTFDITLSTGYHAGGDLGGSGSGGGNIQLHKCPPGWAK